MRSPANVVEEMKWVEENLPEVKEVFFEDDTFTISKKWVIVFTEEYRKRKIKIPWACQARADLDHETMKAMREANCLMAVIGFESASDVVLKNIKKGITLERSQRFIQDAKRAGLPIHGNFVIGLPGETKETIELTKKLITEARADAITVAVATPFPGTEFYTWVKSHDCLLEENPDDFLDQQGHQKAIISYPGLSNREIAETVDKILRNYYLSPAYIPVALRRIFRRYGWDELQLIWRSALGFIKYISNRQAVKT